jgi:hypothetical protein
MATPSDANEMMEGDETGGDSNELTTTSLQLAEEVSWGAAMYSCIDVNQLWAAAVPESDDEEEQEARVMAPHTDGPELAKIKQMTVVGQAEDTESGATHDSIQTEDLLDEYLPPAAEKEGRKETPKHNTVLYWVQTIYSGALLLFSIYIISVAIFRKQTAATGDKKLPPIVAFCLFFGLLTWLALMEGGLNCMVGLQPIDRKLYQDTHKHTHLCQTWVSSGHNLEKFIVGRQFLDLSIVFVSNFLVSSIDNAEFVPLWERVFLDSGLAVIVITIVIGQLVSQINAAHSMLDFINNRAMVVTTFVAMTVEASGLLHAVYFFKHLVSWCTGRTLPPTWDSRASYVWYWFRVAASCALLCLALAVTLDALWNSRTTMWEGVPPIVSLVLLFVLILGTGILEALQIALLTVVHWSPEQLAVHPAAARTCRYALRGNNLQAFLIGRQILQTVVMFILARITTLSDGTDTLLGNNAILRSIVETGLLGALISTIVASLSWRILAWTFPVAFLSVGLVPVKICLAIERTGICSVAWLLAALHRRLVGYKKDEYYIGEQHNTDDVKSHQEGAKEAAY